MSQLNDILRTAVQNKASDVHINVGLPPLFRVHTVLKASDFPIMTSEGVLRILKEMINEKRIAAFEDLRDSDFSYEIPGVGRFRVNAHYQRNTIALSFRTINDKVRHIEELFLPDIVNKLTYLPRGLVLLTGATGCGKSTTLAAMIDAINKREFCHIITIEDPVEYAFLSNKCTIEQREIGSDCPSFASGLRHALRQDPDVIFVGEMRDLETTSAAITAAETGHLVFSTLHTNNASQTIDRIIDAFPVDQQEQIRTQLAQVLRAIVSMELLPRADGQGLLPAIEVLINSPKISRHIERGEIKEIHDEIEKSVAYFRMQSLNQSLVALLANNAITYQVAMERSHDPDDLSLQLRKLFPKIEEAQREGNMAPSPADFAHIIELMEVKRLYEEQEDRWKQRMREREESFAQLEADLDAMRHEMSTSTTVTAELRNQLEALRAEKDRQGQEAAGRIAQLNERIRELNQQLAVSGKAPQDKPSTGFFKR